MTHTPAIVQRWCASNDTNGNPRRAFVIWSSDGTLLDVIDEGYSGKPQWLRELADLGDIKVTATEYREILKQSAARE